MDRRDKQVVVAFGILAFTWVLFSFATGPNDQPILPAAIVLPNGFTINIPGLDFSGARINVVPPDAPPMSPPQSPPGGEGQLPPSSGDDPTAPLNPTPPGINPSAPLTSLMVSVNPSSIQMGGAVLGFVTGDKVGTIITITVTHVGTGSVSTLTGVLGEDGLYAPPPTQISTPGLWSFVARGGDGIVSNEAVIEVRGIKVEVEPDSVQRSEGATGAIHLYSHYVGQMLNVTGAVDGIWDVSPPMYEFDVGQLGPINDGGYFGAIVSFSGAPMNGNFEIDAELWDGDSARNYSATDWVEIVP